MSELSREELSAELKLSEETIGEFNVAELKAEALVAELEAELEYAKRTIKKQDALLESKVLDNAVVALNKANAELEAENLNLMAAISYFLDREDNGRLCLGTWLYSRSTAEELARKLLDQEE